MKMRASLLAVLIGGTAQAQGVDKPISVTLKQRFTIGGAADATFAPAFLFPAFVTTDNAGHLFAVDRAEARVLEYDAKGSHVRTFGRKGRGPGELVTPFAIGVGQDGTVIVSDGSKRALVRYSASGKILPEIGVREYGLLQEIAGVTADTFALYTTVRDTSVLIRLRGEKAERIATLAPVRPRPTPVYDKTCGMAGSESEPLLREMLRVAGRDGVIVYSIASSWGFTILERGRAPRTMSRDRAPEKLTVDMARRILGDSLTMYVADRRCAVPTAAVIEQAGMGTYKPPYERFVLDGKGYVWAIRMTDRGAPRLVDVYSLASGYVGTANVGKAKPAAFMSDGALVSLEVDADEAPIIVVYDVAGLRR